MSAKVDMAHVQLVVPNFKQRLSGVTSTIVQLVPLQAAQLGVATLGPGLPKHLPKIKWWQVPGLLKRPEGRGHRVWHARRNTEMLGGAILKYVFRAPIKLVFTSASQRKHTGWTKFLIRQMDEVIATSRKTAAYLEVKNSVVMHGIDTHRFHVPSIREAAVREVGLDPERQYIGCFGRVRHQKGTDLFVDAMIELLPDHPQWSAIIAGRATAQHVSFENELREKIAKAGLSERIIFVGEHRDIERWYRALSLYVAPQRWEGFGLTPLEAMASGVPVVASDVGAFSELVVQGKTGSIVPFDNLAAICEAVLPYLEDSTQLNAHADNAIRHVAEHFPLEREVAQLLEVYQRLGIKISR